MMVRQDRQLCSEAVVRCTMARTLCNWQPCFEACADETAVDLKNAGAELVQCSAEPHSHVVADCDDVGSSVVVGVVEWRV